MLADHGLTLFAISGHTNLIDPARRQDFLANMRLAYFLGCEFTVSSVGEAHLQDKAVAAANLAVRQSYEYLRAVGAEI
jgi:sugar phosphate isomerase/epimerase